MLVTLKNRDIDLCERMDSVRLQVADVLRQIEQQGKTSGLACR